MHSFKSIESKRRFLKPVWQEKMIILGIDTGPATSGVVIVDTKKMSILKAWKEHENVSLLSKLRSGEIACQCCAIEHIRAMGFAVDNNVFDSCHWAGRFQEAWETKARGARVVLVPRGDVKIALCGRATYKDPLTGRLVGVKDKEINAAVRNFFTATGGGKDKYKGTKSNPGPLYGITSHSFSALAVAITAKVQFDNGVIERSDYMFGGRSIE